LEGKGTPILVLKQVYWEEIEISAETGNVGFLRD
jgi:hypothetical protein